jgi:hypothetical protein
MRFISAISDACSWIEIENIIDELKPILVQDPDGLGSGGREIMLLEEVVKETIYLAGSLTVPIDTIITPVLRWPQVGKCIRIWS